MPTCGECLVGQPTCARCGHELLSHTFLIADMDRCHEEGCGCPGFVCPHRGGALERGGHKLTWRF